MTVDMSLRFKGDRNYIQGGDFVNEIDSVLESTRDARISEIAFRAFAKHQCRLWLEPPPSSVKVVASGAGKNETGASFPFWVQEGAEPIVERYPFDEASIVAATQREGDEILLASPLPYSLIELAIAMTKVLAYANSPVVSGKWVFGQLKLTRPLPRGYRAIRVLQKALVANRFSNNVITVDDKVLGDMRFIVGSP